MPVIVQGPQMNNDRLSSALEGASMGLQSGMANFFRLAELKMKDRQLGQNDRRLDLGERQQDLREDIFADELENQDEIRNARVALLTEMGVDPGLAESVAASDRGMEVLMAMEVQAHELEQSKASAERMLDYLIDTGVFAENVQAPGIEIPGEGTSVGSLRDYIQSSETKQEIEFALREMMGTAEDFKRGEAQAEFDMLAGTQLMTMAQGFAQMFNGDPKMSGPLRLLEFMADGYSRGSVPVEMLEEGVMAFFEHFFETEKNRKGASDFGTMTQEQIIGDETDPRAMGERVAAFNRGLNEQPEAGMEAPGIQVRPEDVDWEQSIPEEAKTELGKKLQEAKTWEDQRPALMEVIVGRGWTNEDGTMDDYGRAFAAWALAKWGVK